MKFLQLAWIVTFMTMKVFGQQLYMAKENSSESLISAEGVFKCDSLAFKWPISPGTVVRKNIFDNYFVMLERLGDDNFKISYFDANTGKTVDPKSLKIEENLYYRFINENPGLFISPNVKLQCREKICGVLGMNESAEKLFIYENGVLFRKVDFLDTEDYLGNVINLFFVNDSILAIGVDGYHMDDKIYFYNVYLINVFNGVIAKKVELPMAFIALYVEQDILFVFLDSDVLYKFESDGKYNYRFVRVFRQTKNIIKVID